MAIRIPESLRDALRDAEINISVELPNPKITTKADKDGLLSLSASYDIGEIYKTTSNVANAIYEAIDNVIIEELLVLNGYVKGCSADRTCRMNKKESKYVLSGWWECNECGIVYPPCNEEIALWALQYCQRYGAKVVQE